MKDENGLSELRDFGNEIRSIHYFGYFALVSLLRLKILVGDFRDAL